MRTKTVKRSSRHVIEKYYNKLGVDFDTNKRVLDEVAVVQSKVSVREPRRAGFVQPPLGGGDSHPWPAWYP